jgi:CubicO group peptidase (beta-lactamase class C family)
LRHRIGLILFGLILTGAHSSAAQAAMRRPEAVSASKIENANIQTRSFLKVKMAELKIPGLQVAVIVRGRVVMSEAYGLANVEHGVPVNRETLFPINSATKSFTDVAIMQLAEAGLVDLEAPISRYLDDLPEGWRSVRVRQLLSHSSGLPNIVDGGGLIATGGEMEAWAKVKTLPVEAVPGTRFAYNQTNYGLLARIINKQSGVQFTQFFANRQFKPANMTRTVFGDTFDVIRGTANIYSYIRSSRSGEEKPSAQITRWIDDLPPFLRTAAGINTNADELAQWIIALGDGRLLKKSESVPSMWQPDRLNDGTTNQWAMGWPVFEGLPRRMIGGLGGGRSAFFIFPEDDVAVIILTNLVGASPHRFVKDVAGHYKAAGNP